MKVFSQEEKSSVKDKKKRVFDKIPALSNYKFSIYEKFLEKLQVAINSQKLILNKTI